MSIVCGVLLMLRACLCFQFMVVTQVEARCCFSRVDVFLVLSFSFSVGLFGPCIVLLLSFNAMIHNSPACSRKKSIYPNHIGKILIPINRGPCLIEIDLSIDGNSCLIGIDISILAI
jgi:hypothetical protein